MPIRGTSASAAGASWVAGTPTAGVAAGSVASSSESAASETKGFGRGISLPTTTPTATPATAAMARVQVGTTTKIWQARRPKWGLQRPSPLQGPEPALAPRFEGRDLVLVTQGEGHVVPAVEQA